MRTPYGSPPRGGPRLSSSARAKPSSSRPGCCNDGRGYAQRGPHDRNGGRRRHRRLTLASSPPSSTVELRAVITVMRACKIGCPGWRPARNDRYLSRGFLSSCMHNTRTDDPSHVGTFCARTPQRGSRQQGARDRRFRIRARPLPMSLGGAPIIYSGGGYSAINCRTTARWCRACHRKVGCSNLAQHHAAVLTLTKARHSSSTLGSKLSE